MRGQLLHRVGDLVTERVVEIMPTATLRQAAELMTDERVGVLVVRRPDVVVGLVGERDVVRALSDGLDPDEERVGDHMADQLVEVRSNQSLVEALEAMRLAEVRHVVVDGGRGVLSMRRVVEHLLAE